MIEPLAIAASPILATDPVVPVTVVYDAGSGKVTYNGQSRLRLPVTGPSVIALALTTQNLGPTDQARFYAFTISPSWSDAIAVQFLSDTEMSFAIPGALSGTFTFTPQIQKTGTGQPITAPGSVTLIVSAASSALGAPAPAPTGNDPQFRVTYDTANRTIDYEPHSLVVPPGETAVTITTTLETGPADSGAQATFYGFAIQSGWLPVMAVSMTPQRITIVDPNTVDNPLPGNFGFVTLVQAPDGALGVQQNPDPTIVNTDIPPTPVV